MNYLVLVYNNRLMECRESQYGGITPERDHAFEHIIQNLGIGFERSFWVDQPVEVTMIPLDTEHQMKEVVYVGDGYIWHRPGTISQIIKKTLGGGR